MESINLPFDRGHVSLQVDEGDWNVLSAPGALGHATEADQKSIVLQALENPIGGVALVELAKKSRSSVILCSDHTRPVPSKLLIPPLLDMLRGANPEIDITLLVATGCHRDTTRQELIDKFGEEIVRCERILIHDCMEESMLTTLGVLPSGAVLTINRLAVETDLLLAEGFIEPHFFAGFSGGRKSVLPGICGKETILGNHCSAFINSPQARTGNLQDNPIQEDMAAAARMANLRFILNVALDSDKNVIAAFAGDPLQAHAEGCRYVSRRCAVAAHPADIVVVTNGGYPLDQNLYQCVKGMTAAEATAKAGAVIIMVAGCADGVGGESFYETLRDAASPAQLLRYLSDVPMEQTIPDQWQSQILARILAKHTVIVNTMKHNKQYVEDMKMPYAETLEEAMAMARRIKAEDASVTVIPDGVSVIVQ